MRRLIWLATPVILMISSCREPPLECDLGVLEDRDRGWSHAALEQDLNGLMAFYHQDGVQLAPGGAVIQGTEDLRQMFSRLFADPDYSLSWSLEVARVSDSCDVGYTRGDWTIVQRNAAGVLTESTGKYLGVWVKDDTDSWVVLEDIFNRGSSRIVD